MDYRSQLLAVAKAYASARDLSLARVSTLVRNDGKFFKRLEEGAGCTMETFQRTLEWFSSNWPSQATWPAETPRPAAAPPAEEAA